MGRNTFGEKGINSIAKALNESRSITELNIKDI